MVNMDELLDRVKSGASWMTETVSKVTKTTASKVENKTREAKIRYAMHEVEERMQNNYAAIGKSVYESSMANKELDDFTEVFGSLDALKDELEALKEKLYDECDLRVCPQCNTGVKKEDSFCPKCGIKMSDYE